MSDENKHVHNFKEFRMLVCAKERFFGCVSVCFHTWVKLGRRQDKRKAGDQLRVKER